MKTAVILILDDGVFSMIIILGQKVHSLQLLSSVQLQENIYMFMHLCICECMHAYMLYACRYVCMLGICISCMYILKYQKSKSEPPVPNCRTCPSSWVIGPCANIVSVARSVRVRSPALHPSKPSMCSQRNRNTVGHSRSTDHSDSARAPVRKVTHPSITGLMIA